VPDNLSVRITSFRAPRFFRSRSDRPRGEQRPSGYASGSEFERVSQNGKPPRRPKVIVTGFGDFGEWDAAAGKPNPSGELARRLAELGLTGADIEYRRLDVTQASVDAFVAEMEQVHPDVILSMGVSGGPARVEEAPENWIGPRIDGAGNPITAGPNDPSRPSHERLATDLPVEAIDRALDAAAPTLPNGRTVQTGHAPDDSGYLCNYLNYRLTQAFGTDDGVTAGFVHVNTETTPEEIAVLVQAVVDARRRAPRVA
jgi:pyrrolidone-carboxylate peptidase